MLNMLLPDAREGWDFQALPPMSPETQDSGLLVRGISDDGAVWDYPEKHLPKMYRTWPNTRLVPGPDFNKLILTAEDRAFLWGLKITDWREDHADL